MTVGYREGGAARCRLLFEFITIDSIPVSASEPGIELTESEGERDKVVAASIGQKGMLSGYGSRFQVCRCGRSCLELDR